MSTILPTSTTNYAPLTTTPLQDSALRGHYTAGVSTLHSMQESEETMVSRYIEDYWIELNADYASGGPFPRGPVVLSDALAFMAFRDAINDVDTSTDFVLKQYSWLSREIRNELKLYIWQNLGSPQTNGENTGFIHLREQPHSSAVLNAVAKVAVIHPNLLEEDQMTPSIQSRDRKIEGVELVVRSAAAGLLGFAPFLTSKVGEGVVKGCAFIAQEGKKFLSQFGGLGTFAGEALRVILGVPALFGGSLLFAGALIFSKTQELIWSRELVEYPQEEKINTQLARYGAGSKPWGDFVNFVGAFFNFSDSQKTETSLSEIRNFEAT